MSLKLNDYDCQATKKDEVINMTYCPPFLVVFLTPLKRMNIIYKY
jgi:hypothetical protein